MDLETPFGVESDARLPAVHLKYDEAAAYCQWRGARLPSEAEWREAAYLEAEIYRIPVSRPGQSIRFRQVTRRSALTACLNVNIAFQLVTAIN